MNTNSLMMNAETSFVPEVASSSWMDQISVSLGISGDPQGFFLYLLIMVGIFIVISILIYNWLEERRFNKQVESNFSSIEEDALLNDKQQQFFDKFASTTGVLNDEPPEGTFIDESGEALEDDRSIEDVYAELLETMSKRNRKDRVEPEGLTIDHQQVASEPVFEVQVDDIEASYAQEPTLYIPESAEITDAEIVTYDAPDISAQTTTEDTRLDLTFGESDMVNMPVEVASNSAAALETKQGNVATLDTSLSESSLSESSEVQKIEPATEEDSIKAIINRAFKEKYNPNFKAEQEAKLKQTAAQNTQDAALSNEETVVEVDDAPEVDAETAEPILDDAPSVPEEIPALTEPVVEEQSITTEPVFEDSSVKTEPVFEEPPIITDTVEEDSPDISVVIEDNEAPELSFPDEEVPEVLPSETTEIQEEFYSADDNELDFLKGLDDSSEIEEESIQEQAIADPASPTLDDPVPDPFEQTEPIEPLRQTYQQLLNSDAADKALDQDDALLLSPKIPQSDQDEELEKQAQAAESAAEEAKEEAEHQSEAAPVEKPSLFTDELPALLNPHIDFIGTIEAAKGSTAAFILSSFSGFHQQFEFPVFVFMQSQQSQWLLLNDVTEAEIARYLERYKPVHITASIQMADRTGPISRNTIQRFKQSLTEIAVTMGTVAKWVDTSEPVDRAASLDAFCIEVDKTMFFHLANPPSPFTGTKLKGLVETQGMVLEKDGAYKYYDLNTASGTKRGVPDFVLFNRDNHKFTEEMLRSSVIKAVTMQLDIPLIPTSGAALDRMVVIAQSLESSLNAKLVDDKNRLITDVHLARIREQIKSIHAAMQLRGIIPGSTHAQRLFS